MTRTDKAIFIFSVLLSLVLILFSNSVFKTDGRKTVIIEVDGEIYAKYDLDSEKEAKSLEINTKYGYNNVVIENGSVFVTDASCPDKLEVKEGGISKTGEMLVCLPNRVVIRIAGESEVDFVAY